jgi:hypothetical protein
MTMMEAKGATLFRPTIADQDVRSYDSFPFVVGGSCSYSRQTKGVFRPRFAQVYPRPRDEGAMRPARN